MPGSQSARARWPRSPPARPPRRHGAGRHPPYLELALDGAGPSRAARHERAVAGEQRRRSCQPRRDGRPMRPVIITCYDLGQFLDEAVASVLARVSRIANLVVDDGSTDAATRRLLDGYQRPADACVAPAAPRAWRRRATRGWPLWRAVSVQPSMPTTVERRRSSPAPWRCSTPIRPSRLFHAGCVPLVMSRGSGRRNAATCRRCCGRTRC